MQSTLHGAQRRGACFSRKQGSGKQEPEKDPLIKRETLELVRAYYKIGHSASRKRIFEMVKALGAVGYSQAPGVAKRKGRSWSHDD